MITDSLRDLYDSQLRTAAEVEGADAIKRIGPLWLATYVASHRGFVTYVDLAGQDPDSLIDAVVDHFARDPKIERFEWKTRGHDAPADLLDHLRQHAFAIEDEETVMAGPAHAVIAAGAEVPPGYSLVRASTGDEFREAARLAGDVFGDDADTSRRRGDELAARAQRSPDAFELWFVRDAAARVVCTGRVDFVRGTDFAGLWGGACDPAHRGRGLYRAVTVARARSALARGKSYLQSDCTPYSRPILQRAGLCAITTTTPAVWRRDRQA